MDIEKTLGNDDWIKKDDEWLNRSTYFSRKRGKYRVKWIKYVETKCSICGKTHLQKKGNGDVYKRTYCSDACRSKAIKDIYSGDKHMSWRGGTYKNGKGYIMVKVPDHHRADRHGYVLLSVIIAEKTYGRDIKRDEVVHHINRVRDDNRIENLIIMKDREHKSMHAKQPRKKKGEKNA